uniref:Uncharacterized protein n=1 Tax=Micrurus corallinus TaxID=54390 RepID=A0A2D4FF83_MICCO
MFYRIESALSKLLYKHIFTQIHFQLTKVRTRREKTKLDIHNTFDCTHSTVSETSRTLQETQDTILYKFYICDQYILIRGTESCIFSHRNGKCSWGQSTIKDSQPIILSAGSQRFGINRLQKMVSQKQKQASQENHS